MTAGGNASRGGTGRHNNPNTAVVFRSTPDYALGSFNDVFIVIWRQLTTADGARAAHGECSRFAAVRRGGIGLLTIVEARTPMPNAQARDALATFLKEASGYIRASAVIFEGNAFRASAVRGVATGLTLLAKQPFPHKFFIDAAAATGFLSQALGNTNGERNPESLLAGIVQLRQLIVASESKRAAGLNPV